MGMKTYNMHGTFSVQLPDYFEYHYKEKDEIIPRYFIARYHPEDEFWGFYASAEQSISITNQYKSGQKDGDYTSPEQQEAAIAGVKYASSMTEGAMLKVTNGLVGSTLRDSADNCPYIYHAEKDHIVIIGGRSKDYSKVDARLEINDGTFYEFSIFDNRDVPAAQKEEFARGVLDSIKIGTDPLGIGPSAEQSSGRKKNSKSRSGKSGAKPSSSEEIPGMSAYNMHGTFSMCLPDSFETHYTTENEDIPHYFVARCHPNSKDRESFLRERELSKHPLLCYLNSNDWESFSDAEQSVSLSYDLNMGIEGADYSDDAAQEEILTQIKRLNFKVNRNELDEGNGVKLLFLEMLIFFPDCPYIQYAERDHIVIIAKRTKDFSSVLAFLGINDGTSYLITLSDNREVPDDEKEKFVCGVLDSIKIGTSSRTGKASEPPASNDQFEIEGTALLSYKGNASSVTIPEGIEEIKPKAFYRKDSVTEVLLPESLTKIGDWAFGYCKNLKSIDIPDSVQSIGVRAFADCEALEYVGFPLSLNFLGHHAFHRCEKLREVLMVGNIKTIEEETFSGCSSMDYVEMPDSIVKIGPSAFDRCEKLEQVYLSGSLEKIGASAFFGCSALKRITFPDTLKEIGTAAFSFCSLITSVTLPKSLKKIGERCFNFCRKLENVEILGPVKQIPAESFSTCAITQIRLPKGLRSIQQKAFYRNGRYEDDHLWKILIPETVVEIDGQAFDSNPNLEIYCAKGSCAEKYATEHNFRVITDPAAVEAEFPKIAEESPASQETPSGRKAVKPEKQTAAPKSTKKPEDCPIPKDFKDYTTITDQDFTPESSFAQSAVSYVLETLSKIDLNHPGIKSDHELGNELFLNLINVGSFREYQNDILRTINEGPFMKAMMLYTIRDFFGSVRQAADESERDRVTASYSGLFVDMLRFLYTNDSITETDQLLRGMGTIGLRYRDVIVNDVSAFAKKPNQTPEIRLRAAREWLTEICRQPDIRILCSDKRVNPVLLLQLFSEDAIFFRESDFEWDEAQQKHIIHGIQANQEVMWNYPELFFNYKEFGAQICGYLTELENSGLNISQKDRSRPLAWSVIGAWTPFALFIAVAENQIAVSFTEDGQVYLCFTEMMKPFEKQLLKILSDADVSVKLTVNIVPSRKDTAAHRIKWGLSVPDSGFCPGQTLLDKTRDVLREYNKTYERIIAYAWPGPKIQPQQTVGLFGFGAGLMSPVLQYTRFSKINFDDIEDDIYIDPSSEYTRDAINLQLGHVSEFSEEKRALHYARLFRVSEAVFKPNSDRECEIRDGYIKQSHQLRTFRSFIWSLASLLSDQGKGLDEVTAADIRKVIAWIEEKNNYQEDSYFPELCGLPDNFNIYTDLPLPGSRIAAACLARDESTHDTVNNLGTLSGLRNELRLLIPAMDLVYADLKAKRDPNLPLEGTGADILNCWCVIALAAESNVVTSSSLRLGMFWDRFDDEDDFQDTRKPSEIISGIPAPWMGRQIVSAEEAAAIADLKESVNKLQTKLAQAADSAAKAAEAAESFNALQEEANKRDAEKDQNIKDIAAEACKYGRDSAWLYFILHNEWMLGTLNCGDDEFWEENQKYFPEIPRETVLLRRRQAMPLLSNPNIYNNQFRALSGTDFEQRFTMLVRHFIDRVSPIDPWMHVNTAFGRLRNFFAPQEQQIMWSRLCDELVKQRQDNIALLSALNPDFADFETAKRYLVIRLEDPDPEKYDRTNPYNYLCPEAYIAVGLYDESKMGLFVNFIPSQAWVWNTTLDEVYRAALRNIDDARSVKSDAEELLRKLLPQYFG